MTLFTYRRETVSFTDALAAFAPDATALVYAPRWCGFARFVGGKLVTPTGLIPTDTYEVRVFHESAELRWLKNPATADGTGDAAIVRDSKDELSGWTEGSREVVTLQPFITYLLWGEVTNRRPAPEWGEVATARVGAIAVPDAKREFRPKARVLLHAVEYVAEDEYGSAFVCEERLTKLALSEGDSND